MESGALPWDYRAIVLSHLKPDSKLLVMGTGGGNNHDLAKRLIPGCAPSFPEHTLSANVRLLEAAGFEIIRREEAFPRVRFYDVAALVYFAGIIEWEFPGFSVDTSFEQLISLQEELETTGHIDGTEHRFLIAAAKK